MKKAALLLVSMILTLCSFGIISSAIPQTVASLYPDSDIPDYNSVNNNFYESERYVRNIDEGKCYIHTYVEAEFNRYISYLTECGWKYVKEHENGMVIYAKGNAAVFYKVYQDNVYIYVCDDYAYISDIDLPETGSVTLYSPDSTIIVSSTTARSYISAGWSLVPYVTVWNAKGEVMHILSSDVDRYAQYGWSANITDVKTTLYSSDGRTLSVFNSEVESYVAVGLYKDKYTTIYTTDGRSETVPTGELNSYLNAGWYPYPVTILYSKYGDTKIVPTAEARHYLPYGWCTDKSQVYTTLYSSDGRTIEVLNTQVNSYIAYGWSTTKHETVTSSYLPVTFTQGGKTMTLTDFNVSNVRYYTSDKKTIGFDVFVNYDGPRISMNVNCYDDASTLISTIERVDFYSGRSIALIFPFNAAYFQIVPCSTAHNSVVSGSYTYANPVTVYAMDGRSKTIFDLQVPYYRDNFWYEAETLYSIDGRTITVPPYEAEAYMAVGWYTYDGYQYAQMEQYVQRLFNSKAFADAYIYVTNCEANFKGTEYEYSAAALKSKAMDEWRKYINCPIAYISNYVNNYYGAPSARITLRNLSYKEVETIRIKFTCYNAFGEVIKTYNPYTFSNAQLSPGEERMYNLPFYGHDYAYSIGNVEIVEVAYTDGTKWKK